MEVAVSLLKSGANRNSSAWHEGPRAHAVTDQQKQDDKQQGHEQGGEGLKPRAHAARHDQHGDHDRHRVPEQQLHGAGHEGLEHALDRGAIQATEAAGGRLLHVGDGPAHDHAVVTEDEETRDHAHPAEITPGGRGAFLPHQFGHGVNRAAPSTAAKHDLGDQDRRGDQQDAGEVNHYEGAAAVLPKDVGELPDVAEADGGPGGGKDERQAGGPLAMDGFALGDSHRSFS